MNMDIKASMPGEMAGIKELRRLVDQEKGDKS
jgi:hypothetical protein